MRIKRQVEFGKAQSRSPPLVLDLPSPTELERRRHSPSRRLAGAGARRVVPRMGCSMSGLNALYDAANGGGDVWINERHFRVLRQIGEGGFAFVYLVKEHQASADAARGRHPSHASEDGTYAMKKVLIQSKEQLDLVKEEIRVSSLFNHPSLLPLLDHAIISVKGDWNNEAYLLFPVYMDGTLFDNAKVMQSRKEFYSTIDVLRIFQQLCEGLKHMHSFDPPYAHNDVKPGNVLVTHRKGQAPLATLMDFGSARPARKEIRSRSEALTLQVRFSPWPFIRYLLLILYQSIDFQFSPNQSE
ncbi:hypothetical protein GUJ93_ZPchr0009g1890 [Zizania palustris]|uniref:non-specific serine/threonine protein kinase n=1 Tax=Zizania palustris TaxID=103762 RepID=A0A8J5RM06_ZIZPA|nr:hypothetical protein GUJ93_ZPchr0009g1890 [Zizania palustris]